MSITIAIIIAIFVAAIAYAIGSHVAGTRAAGEILRIQEEHKQALVGMVDQGEKRISDLNERQTQELNRLKTEHNEAMKRERENYDKSLSSMREAFAALSAEQLKSNSEDLKKGNKEQIDILLKPMQEEFKKFTVQMDQFNKQNIEDRTKLQDSIKNMMERTLQIGNEANNLTNALKGEKKTQGNWGETMLTDILDCCGLQEGMHYLAQTAIKDNTGTTLAMDGKRQIPDVVIKYPDNKCLAVDSKVTLNSLVEYSNAGTEEAKATLLNKFLGEVKAHINELSNKRYQDGLKAAGRESVDFVVMFIPMESAFQLFLSKYPDVWNEAYTKHVIVCGPSSLLPILLIVRDNWHCFNLTKHNQEFIKDAAAMFDRMNTFANYMVEMRNALSKADNILEAMDKKLYTGNQSVAGSIRKLEAHGVKFEKKNVKAKLSKLFDDSQETIEISGEEVGYPED